jgi:hypothetical protein
VIPRLVAVLVPFLAVLGPAVAMRIHGNVMTQIREVVAIGLVGALLVALIGRFGWPRALVLAVAGAVAIGVSTVAHPFWAVWIGAGLAVAGAIGTVPVIMRAVLAVARGIGTAVGLVLLVPLAVLVVVVPWLVNGLIRVDPLRAPTPKGSGWLPRRRRDVLATQPWVGDPAIARHSLARRIRSFAIWPLLIVGGLLLTELATRDDGRSGLGVPTISELNADPSADAPLDDTITTGPDGQPLKPFDGAEWYPEWVRDMAWIENVNTAWQPLQPHRIGDVKTPLINVKDGVRRSWHPPACDCKRLKVWMYGGSTMFGLGQRDAHTIASELARAAWRDGVALDIDNRGVVGDVHWQEANRYSWDLATYGPPDLVIFYDGINDTSATQTLVNRQEGDRYAQVDFQNDDQWAHIIEANPQEQPDDLPGAEVLHPKRVRIDDLGDYARLLWVRYERARKMSRNLSTDDHVPTYYMWQPNRLSRPQVPGEPEDSEGSANGRQREVEITARIPDDVIDLTAVFDRSRRALFYDDQHHNEIGARIMGEAMYARLASDLHKLVDGDEVDAAP